jgi:hypothetical protein
MSRGAQNVEIASKRKKLTNFFSEMSAVGLGCVKTLGQLGRGSSGQRSAKADQTGQKADFGLDTSA